RGTHLIVGPFPPGDVDRFPSFSVDDGLVRGAVVVLAPDSEVVTGEHRDRLGELEVALPVEVPPRDLDERLDRSVRPFDLYGDACAELVQVREDGMNHEPLGRIDPRDEFAEQWPGRG